MPRVTYWQLFRLLNANALDVLRKVKIGSAEFDAGAVITRGTIIAGLDLFKYVNSEIEEIESGDVFVIERIYTS